MRKQLGYTQQRLASELGKGVSTISRWECVSAPGLTETAELFRYATTNGCRTEARVFQAAIESQLGISVSMPKAK